MSDNNFDWPWQYTFPPFFTLQPNLTTRKKQLEAWKSLVLEYHKKKKLYALDLTEALSIPLFYNKDISRKLDQDSIRLVIDELCLQNNAEWLDKQKQRCYIYWRTPEEWGKLIYKWIQDSGLTNSVCTMFELTQGDDIVDQEFYGLDVGVLKKALATLEKEGLAEIMGEGDMEGVKFF